MISLSKYIPGPDFPTGAFIYGREEIHNAYRTGRGILQMRAKAAIDRVGRGNARTRRGCRYRNSVSAQQSAA
ncbi:MAG: DNA gyrase subunit A [Pyrinomonadaceae bacterium]